MGTEAFAELEDEEQFADPELLIPEGIPTKEILWEERVQAINGDGGYDSGDGTHQANEMVDPGVYPYFPMGYQLPLVSGHFPTGNGLHASEFAVPNGRTNGSSQSPFTDTQLFEASQRSPIMFSLEETMASESNCFGSINGGPSNSTTQTTALNKGHDQALPPPNGPLDLEPAQQDVFDVDQYLNPDYTGDEYVMENGVEHRDEGESSIEDGAQS
jgi:hypothetical protein